MKSVIRNIPLCKVTGKEEEEEEALFIDPFGFPSPFSQIAWDSKKARFQLSKEMQYLLLSEKLFCVICGPCLRFASRGACVFVSGGRCSSSSALLGADWESGMDATEWLVHLQGRR